MPKVPEARIGGVERRGSNWRVDVQTNANMFGGLELKRMQADLAAQRGRMAGINSIVGGVLGIGDILAKEQEKEEQALLDQAEFDAKTKMLEMTRAYKGLQGQDAMGARQNFYDDFDKFTRERASKLPNQRLRTQFEQRRRNALLSMDSTLSSHYVQQRDFFEKQQRANVITTTVSAATDALASGNLDLADGHINRILELSLQTQDDLGLHDTDAAQLYAAAQVDKVVAATIEPLLTSEAGVAQSRALLDRYADRMTPASRIKIEQQIAEQEKSIALNKTVAIAFNDPSLSRKQQEELIRVNFPDAEDRAKGVQLLDKFYTAREKQQTETIGQLTDTLVKANGDITSVVDTPEYKALPPSKKKELVEAGNKMSAGTFETNGEAYVQMHLMKAAGELDNKSEMELRAMFGTKVKPEHLDRLINDLKGKSQITEEASRSLFKRYFGKTDKDLVKPENMALFEVFDRELRREADRVKDYSDKALRQIGSNLATEGERRGASWYETAPNMTRLDAIIDGETGFVPFTPDDAERSVDSFNEMLGGKAFKDNDERDRFYRDVYRPVLQQYERITAQFPDLAGKTPQETFDLLRRIHDKLNKGNR